MKANSVNRLAIDWTGFRSQVLAAAASAQTVADTYPAITVALGLLATTTASTQRPAVGAS